jgi:hypothetical protein
MFHCISIAIKSLTRVNLSQLLGVAMDRFHGFLEISATRLQSVNGSLNLFGQTCQFLEVRKEHLYLGALFGEGGAPRRSHDCGIVE